MKKIQSKSILLGVILCSLFTAACSNESEPATQEEAVSLFTDYANLQEVTLAGEDQINLKYTNEGWIESNGEVIDQDAANSLLTDLIQLTGTSTKPSDISDVVTIEPFLTITLRNENQEEKTVELIKDEEERFYAKESEEVIYSLSQLPEEWQQFSLVMLQMPLKLNVNNIDEIEYTDDESNFILNHETTLSDVETSPFISGWFLHSDLQTEFSVEYNQMEQLLASLTSLKGKASETVGQEAFTNPIQIELRGNENQETLLIGSKGKVENYTYVKTESNQTVYQVPDVFIRNLKLLPAEIVDNFIMLLPLTAITSIEITSEDANTMIEAKHDVVENEAEELEVASEFFVNDEKVDTAAFRKTYQYLAMLSYEEEVENYSIPLEETTGEINIVYTFKDNGETLQHTIRFIPYQKEKYVVVKNDHAEFTAPSEQIESMLRQLSLITNN